jgi:hypothetical protein
MERKVTWRTIGFKQYKNGSKGKNPGQTKKKSHRGHGCLCCVCCIRTVIWNVKWHEGRKDLNSTKMDQRGKTPDRQKKNPPGAWISVSCECCVLSGRGLCDDLSHSTASRRSLVRSVTTIMLHYFARSPLKNWCKKWHLLSCSQKLVDSYFPCIQSDIPLTLTNIFSNTHHMYFKWSDSNRYFTIKWFSDTGIEDWDMRTYNVRFVF